MSVMVECGACNASGECMWCSGEGFEDDMVDVECSFCHGTGLCDECHGNGEIEEMEE